MSYEFSAFKLSKLNGYAEIQPGFAFKSDKFVEDPSQTPLVKGENVQQGFIDWQASRYWNTEEYDALNKFHLNPGDIVLAMDRPWVTAGLKWSYIKKHDPKALLVQRVSRLRAKKGLDQTYLRCLISSSYFTAYIQPIVTGVNVPHISGKQIGDFKIPLPSIDEQRKIAATLSAYDDLIENNKRRIALLENMAKEIYREWFVRFRFPGYKNTEFEKGIPKEWKEVQLENFCEKVTDGTHDTPKPTEVGRYLVTGKNIKNSQINFNGAYRISENDHIAISKRSGLKEWDILFSNIGTIGETAIVGETSNYSVKNVIIFRPKDSRHSLFLAQVLKNPAIVEHLLLIATGASQQFIGLGVARGYKILCSDIDLINLFGERVAGIYEQIANIQKINSNLCATKKMLLPRLISGKLSVENLNIQFPPSMQEESAA